MCCHVPQACCWEIVNNRWPTSHTLLCYIARLTQQQFIYSTFQSGEKCTMQLQGLWYIYEAYMLVCSGVHNNTKVLIVDFVCQSTGRS